MAARPEPAHRFLYCERVALDLQRLEVPVEALGPGRGLPLVRHCTAHDFEFLMHRRRRAEHVQRSAVSLFG
jgi:hypothetical protein